MSQGKLTTRRHTAHAGTDSTGAGFTMIELLVVVAIVSLLAGILFPVLAKSRQRAQRVVCLANLRQIGMALSMYAGDHDGLIPPAEVPGQPWRATHHIWDGTISPPCYLGLGYLHEQFGYGVRPEMYYCPLAHGQNRMDAPHAYRCWEQVGPNYREHMCGTSYVYRESGIGGKRILSQNTDTPAMVMDFQIDTANAYSHFLEGVNIVFYDGSVKWVPDPTAQAAGLGVDMIPESYELAFEWADKQY